MAADTPKGWDSIESGIDTNQVQLPKDSRWDARSPFMTAVIQNLRHVAKDYIGEHNARFTDQDLLDIYSESYFMDDPEQDFKDQLANQTKDVKDD